MAPARLENESARTGPPIRSGVFVAVVGPSGAGKDTLIDAARRLVDKADAVFFVRRVITRPPQAGGEDHHAMDDATFEAALRDRAFALAWNAHGLRYAIPAEVDTHVACGQVAVANVSRAALPLFAARYRNLSVVNVTAPAEVLAARLAARGRESQAAIRTRLARADAALPALPDGTVTIENTGPVEQAAALLAGSIHRAVALSTVSDIL